MIIPRKLQEGFSAVELLLTLFIGSLFIIAGNQLYIYVISSGEEANQRARASNIGYQYMQTKAPTVSNPCVASSPAAGITYSNVPVEGLTNVNITVSVSCPYAGVSSVNPDQNPLRSISKITSLTKYGSDQVEVLHAVNTTP